MVGLDAHERPPAGLTQLFKRLRSLKASEIESSPEVLDLQLLGNDDETWPDGLRLERHLPRESLNAAFDEFLGGDSHLQTQTPPELNDGGVAVYSVRQVPGLQILPSLLPPELQKTTLSRLLHRDLSDERHQTNIHLHYDVSYPSPADACTTGSRQHTSRGNPSFFRDDPNRMLVPKDATVHAPLSIRTFLDSKLRWVTLGGQYNWTSKEYPAETPPDFPQDIANLLRGVFPETHAEAAIVNVYSPGDRLSVHRDVSEECDAGLVSVSFGCDGLFIVGMEDEASSVVIRLRSGDAVYMAGSSRFAWHAVPKILPSTCPAWLQAWPGDGDGDCTADKSDPCQQWWGWMSNKRINLNVRQMRPNPDKNSNQNDDHNTWAIPLVSQVKPW